MTREGHQVTTPALPTSRDASLTAWALAARAGDPDAVDQFVRALHRDVRRYVTYLGADPQTADDLAQDTFLAIARRAVIDSFRTAAARPRLADSDDWQLAAERAQPCGLPGFDDGIALDELLAELPEERREAFVLTQLLGLPYAEAALVSDCPIGTVRSRVARARSALIASLSDAERCGLPERRELVGAMA
jgi:RNA polymerase sigma-70 factor (ECF subfamily)